MIFCCCHHRRRVNVYTPQMSWNESTQQHRARQRHDVCATVRPVSKPPNEREGAFVSERFLMFARASHQSERARRLPLTRRLPAPRCLISARWRAAQPHAVAQRGAARRLQGARVWQKAERTNQKKRLSLARAEPVRAALHLSPRRGMELDASQVLRPAGRRACVLVAAVTNFPRRSDLDGFGSLAHVPGFEFRVDEVTRRMQHAIDALKGGGGTLRHAPGSETPCFGVCRRPWQPAHISGFSHGKMAC